MVFPLINFKKIILVLAIVIVLNLFINYGIDTFYKQSRWEDFCGAANYSSETSDTKEKCEVERGKWNEYAVDSRGAVKPILPPESALAPVPPGGEADMLGKGAGWCDREFYCRENYEKVNSVYKRNVFIILVVAGAAVLTAGFFITQSEAVALGLSLGGLISIFIGTVRYWSEMNDYLRFIALGITLAVLIWLGIKKFSAEAKK